MDNTYATLRIVAKTSYIDHAWFERELDNICFVYGLALKFDKEVYVSEVNYKITIDGPRDEIDMAKKKIEKLKG